MSDTLLVQLNTDCVRTEPGGPPVELVVSVQNLGSLTDQYAIELSGLDPDWFTMPNGTVGLFPKDSKEVRISLHPPKRPDVQAGAYPFIVVVRSRAGTEQGDARAILQVLGLAVFRADLTPRRAVSRRRGNFRVVLANTGSADAQLVLEGHDSKNACTLTFSQNGRPLLRAQSRLEVPLVVEPRDRPWIGHECQYDFVVTVRPEDASGDPQTVAGQYTYRPLLESWAPLWRFLVWAGAALLLLLLLIIVVPTLGLDHWQQTLGSAAASARGLTCDRPIVGALCPDDGTSCEYAFGFNDFHEAAPTLVDDCVGPVTYDRFGNGTQYTRTGLLVWQKESNTVYLFRGDSIWAYVQGQTDLLYGSGRF
jgi:hypothetical protein